MLFHPFTGGQGEGVRRNNQHIISMKLNTFERFVNPTKELRRSLRQGLAWVSFWMFRDFEQGSFNLHRAFLCEHRLGCGLGLCATSANYQQLKNIRPKCTNHGVAALAAIASAYPESRSMLQNIYPPSPFCCAQLALIPIDFGLSYPIHLFP